MEVKELESIKTLENLTEAVQYYRKISDEISRLQVSKDIAKEAILEKFRETGIRHFTAGKLIARVDTRISKFISVKEAQQLLDPDTFNKLCRESASVILSVHQLSKKEE